MTDRKQNDWLDLMAKCPQPDVCRRSFVRGRESAARGAEPPVSKRRAPVPTPPAESRDSSKRESLADHL